MVSRRGMLRGAAGVMGASALAPLSATPSIAAVPANPSLRDRLQADLATYAEFGSKLSGSPGDRDSGAWIAERLAACGLAAQLSDFDVPVYASQRADLTIDGRSIPLTAQPIVVQTPAQGITAPLCLVHDPLDAPNVRGKIAVLVLPYARHAALFRGDPKAFLDAVIPHNPAAIVIVTTGPTGKVIALNTRLESYAKVPIALLAPDDLPPVVQAAAAGGSATLMLTGTASIGQSVNVIARRLAGPRWLAFSTPRSGWGICAGERGPGIAAFLELTRWAAVRYPEHSLFAICTGGHELDFIGTHYAMEEGPPGEQTDIWTHLGAGLAARDALEILGQKNQLLSCADPQRAMMCSHPVLDAVTRSFAGLAGYESPIEVVGGAGELSSIIDRGYANAFAALGIHRWCHVADDTLDKTNGDLLLPVVEAHRAVIEAVVAKSTSMRLT